MNIASIVMIGYLVIVTVIGYVASRGGKGVREFMVAGANLPWTMLVPFLVAERISSTTMVGIAEMAHGFGLQTLWRLIASPIGICFLVFGMAKFYKVIRPVTLGESFGMLFDKKTHLVAVVFLLLSTMLVMGGSSLATGAIIGPVFNIPYVPAVWISAAALSALALLGLRGIAWMNMVHLAVIFICIVPGFVAVLNAGGGLGNVLASLPSEHLNLFRPGGLKVGAWFTGSVGYTLVSTTAVLAVLAAKDEKNARIGGLAAGMFLFLFTMLPLIMGLTAYVIMPDIPSKLAFWEIVEYCGPVISSMAAIGCVAAVVSTTPGVYLALGSIFARDIFLLIKPDASERTQLTVTRFAIPVIAFIGTWFALTQPTIMELGFRNTQMKLLLGIILAVCVLWRRISSAAALWTLILGGGVGFIWWFADLPFGIPPMYPMLAVAIPTMVIASLIKRPSPFKGTEGLDLTLDTERGQRT